MRHIVTVTEAITMYNCINFQLRSYSTCANSLLTYLLIELCIALTSRTQHAMGSMPRVSV